MENKLIYPGIFSRLMSFTYDIFLVAALWFLFGFIFLGLYKLIVTDSDYFPPPIGALIILITTASYYVYFWSDGRNTLGMSTWNHKIINDDGSKLSKVDALKRFLLYLLLNIVGMLWILFDRDNKCLPDKILKLKIVKRRNVS
ncbi:MAG: RDD family protein [Gammaproteobacteria bacterium TMED112]|nr:MAG: RDD family protein [Gammaproteobacteria bacterium TMED112]|tara:strand:+ start:15614 stop:16042 length:429 start_codon:yes stop_codon:yes gene_type:complete